MKLVNARLDTARELARTLDNSHREAGLKEVSGGFVNRLMVDGRVADPATVLKTAVYANECFAEVLSNSASTYAAEHVRTAIKELMDSIRSDKMDRPYSGWLTFWIFFFLGGNTMIIPAVKVLHDQAKVRNQIKVDPRTAPQLFRLYPNIAKVNTTSEAKILDAKRSLPLFGNKAIQVEQYADIVKREEINKTNVPKVTLVNSGRGEVTTKMSALTGAQQKDVLNSAIEMLNTVAEYFTEYKARNTAFYKTYVENLDTGLRFIADNKNQKTPYTNAIIGSAAGWYTRVFWAGIFKEQSDIATYASTTAGALIDLVSASSAVAKANVGGQCFSRKPSCS